MTARNGSGSTDVPDGHGDAPPRSAARVLLASAVAITLCAGLAYLIATQTLVAYLARTDPAQALRLNSDDAGALLESANRKVETHLKARQEARLKALEAQQKSGATGDNPDIGPLPTPDRADLDMAQQQVQRALSIRPLSAAGLRILGHIADLRGEQEKAADLMQRALRLSRREGAAAAWLLERSLERQNFQRSMALADILLRTQPATWDALAAVIAGIAETETGFGLVTEALTENPPWRDWMLRRTPSSMRDAATPMRLFLELKGRGSPVNEDILNTYLHRLVRSNLHEQAYYAWLQFLPAEQLSTIGLVYNGRFRSPPSGSPFDWTITSGAGASVQTAAHNDNRGVYGLSLEVGGGRVEFGSVSQWLLLAPGRYRVSGRVKGRLTGPRGFRWRILCHRGKKLAEGPMMRGRLPAWTEFAFDVAVPNEGCNVQRLALVLDARSTSDKLVRGYISYDAIVITRQAENN